MRSLEYNEIKMISGGDFAEVKAKINTYHNSIDLSSKYSFALGGVAAGLACMVGLPGIVTFGVFSAYGLYISIF